MYAAPELFKRAKPSKASDMWAFGITMLECITGIPPWTNTVPMTIGGLRLRQPDGVSKGILPGTVKLVTNPQHKELIVKLINFDPAKRPSSTDVPAMII